MAGDLVMQFNARFDRKAKVRSKNAPSVKLDDLDTIKWTRDNQAEMLRYLELLLLDAKSILPSYGSCDYSRDLATLKRRFESEGASFATITLPDLFANFQIWLETGRSHYPGFKTTPELKHPVFLQSLFNAIYVDDETERVIAFRLLYQICVSFKKIRGPYPQRVLLKQLEDFVKCDRDLGKVNYNAEYLRHITLRARSIVTKVLDCTCNRLERLLLPRPGPGATNTPVANNMRYEPHVMYKSLDGIFPYYEWFYSSVYDIFHNARSYTTLVETRVEFPTARFKSINKTFGKPRGICIEENENQFFQQAIKRALYRIIELSPQTSGRVNFASQDVNRELALVSSCTKREATIDMSEASDRIQREGVLVLFKNTPFMEMLNAVSTRFIQLCGPRSKDKPWVLTATKFAAMGSGVCFPVMALVHYALIKAIILESDITDKISLSEHVYVYGDDVIIPVECIDAVTAWLPRYGLKLNLEKSFWRSHFRESCGLHAYYGEEVTPVYFQYITNLTLHAGDSTTLLSLLSKESLLHSRGMYNLASYIRDRCHRIYGSLPFVGEDSPVLGWRRPGRTILRDVSRHAVDSYWCWDTQQPCLKLKVVVPVQKVLPPMGERESYLRKQLTKAEDPSHVKDTCEDLRIRRRWILASGV
jgi:hypothetical protein